MQKCPAKRLVAAIAVLWLSQQAAAVQLQSQWVGPFSSGWASSNFWTTSHYPDNGTPVNRTYHAIIESQGNPFTIVLSQSITLDRLTMASESATLQHASGTITLVGGSGADTATRWTAGSYVGSGTFDVQAPFHLVGGSIQIGPMFRIRPSGSLHVYGAAPKALDRYLTNEGLIHWEDGDVDGRQIFNLGELVASAAPGVDVLWGSFVENAGTITKQDGGVSRFLGFENSGMIAVLEGELHGESGGSHTGVFEIGVGATLGASGHFEPDSIVTGDRFLVLDDSTFHGSLDLEHVEVVGGEVDFVRGLSLESLIVHGGDTSILAGLAADALEVLGGSVHLVGPPGFVTTVNISHERLWVDAPLSISESMTFSGGILTGEQEILILPGAMLRFDGLGIFDRFSGRVRNDGHATWANSSFKIGYGVFDNRGELRIETHHGDVITSPEFPSNPAALDNSGRIIKSGAGLASLSGVLVHNTGEVLVEAGAIELFTHNLAVATVNAGLLEALPGAVVQVYGDFRMTADSTLRLVAGLAEQRSAAGIVLVGRTATLSGVLEFELQEGYRPVWGDRWELVEYQSAIGDFAAVSLPPIDHPELRWQFVRGPLHCEVGLHHIADIDHDGHVGFADLNIIISNFNAPGTWEQGDADGSGMVGFADLNLVLSHFNASAPE